MVKPGKLPPSYKRWKKEQDFYFYCTCGCNNGVVIKTETEGDEVCLSLVSDTFYSNQRGFFALLNVEFPFESMKKYNGETSFLSLDGNLTVGSFNGPLTDIPEFRKEVSKWI